MTGPPVTVTPIVTQVMGNSFQINFPGQPPIYTDGNPIDFYVIELNDGINPVRPILVSATADASTVVTGLAPGTCYMLTYSGMRSGQQALVNLNVPPQQICTPQGKLLKRQKPFIVTGNIVQLVRE